MHKKIFKYLLLIILIIPSISFCGDPPTSKAVGLFFSAGVGPRLPIGKFANTTDFGYGLIVETSYTDTDVLPCFIFARLGFEQFPSAAVFKCRTGGFYFNGHNFAG